VSTTTQLPGLDPIEIDVKVSYLVFVDVYWDCLQTPEACDPEAFTAPGSPAVTALATTVGELMAADLFVGNDPVGYSVVEDVVVDPGGESATVRACWWDIGVLYGPPVTEGGPNVIMNNKQVTSRFESTMTLVDGRWLLSEERRIERVEGENLCPPAG
jgi:hypothetical protein